MARQLPGERDFPPLWRRPPPGPPQLDVSWRATLPTQQRLEERELLEVLRRAVQHQLIDRQRYVLLAAALQEVPIDVLAERLESSRGGYTRSCTTSAQTAAAYGPRRIPRVDAMIDRFVKQLLGHAAADAGWEGCAELLGQYAEGALRDEDSAVGFPTWPSTFAIALPAARTARACWPICAKPTRDLGHVCG